MRLITKAFTSAKISTQFHIGPKPILYATLFIKEVKGSVEETQYYGNEAVDKALELTSVQLSRLLQLIHRYVTGWPKIGTSFLYTFTMPNINRFSQLFHSQNQEKICNNTTTKDPTTPEVCRYTM